jgi:hypothetical protein
MNVMKGPLKVGAAILMFVVGVLGITGCASDKVPKDVKENSKTPPESLKIAKTVTVVGCVRVQGKQEIPYDRKLTVSEVILRAGGYSTYANMRKVAVHRIEADEKKIFTVDVYSVLKEGKMENDMELQADDMVIVPEKWVSE